MFKQARTEEETFDVHEPKRGVDIDDGYDGLRPAAPSLALIRPKLSEMGIRTAEGPRSQARSAAGSGQRHRHAPSAAQHRQRRNLRDPRGQDGDRQYHRLAVDCRGSAQGAPRLDAVDRAGHLAEREGCAVAGGGPALRPHAAAERAPGAQQGLSVDAA